VTEKAGLFHLYELFGIPDVGLDPNAKSTNLMTATIVMLSHAPSLSQQASEPLKPERVAGLIREKILVDQLQPGMPIRERTLAEELKVSRTPLREALKILAGEGLVELSPRRGATVADPSEEELRQLLKLLGCLEGFAGVLACENAGVEEKRELRALHYEMLAAYTRGDRLGYFHLNQEIHRALVALSRNAALIEHHRLVNARVYRIRYLSNLRAERWEKAIDEHEKMLDALESRDGERLRAILESHVLRAFEQMLILSRATAGQFKR
jgi:DNA-binding GntR family transcriptional regulator